MRNTDKTQEQINLCCNCGKILSRKETLLSHKIRCTSAEIWREKLEPAVHCKYCDMNFTTRFNANQHENEKHFRETTNIFHGKYKINAIILYSISI